VTEPLPWRGLSAARRPPQIVLGAMPLSVGGRLRKRWRYVGVYGERLMLCAGVVQVGLAGQTFWAVWDRERGVLRERTRLWRGTSYVRLPHTGVHVRDGDVEVALGFVEEDGGGAPVPVETASPVDGGAAWMWTRKTGGLRLRGTVTLGGERVELDDARGVIDESAGYHPRQTDWRRSAGVGALADGRSVAWNLVAGIHDDPHASERTVWVDGVPEQLPPATFSPDLSRVAVGDGALTFAQEAVRSRSENFGAIRSDYTQPFGTFSGTLLGGLELGAAYGVMERHSALW